MVLASRHGCDFAALLPTGRRLNQKKTQISPSVRGADGGATGNHTVTQGHLTTRGEGRDAGFPWDNRAQGG